MAFSMPVDNSTKIATLQALLESGVRQLTVDGITTVYRSADDIRAEIRRLQNEDTTGNQPARPRVRSINLGAAW